MDEKNDLIEIKNKLQENYPDFNVQDEDNYSHFVSKKEELNTLVGKTLGKSTKGVIIAWLS